MFKSKKIVWYLLTSASLLSGFHASSYAQDYPTKPIKIIVPYAPGGATDILARLVSKRLSEDFSQPLVVENKPGGNTGIAASNVARSAPDGYTLLFTNDATYVLNPLIFKTLNYDVKKDFLPVGTVASLSFGLAVSENTKANTLNELIDLTQHNNTLSYGSYGVGSQAHLMGELYKVLTKSDLTHVPYKGSSQAVVDVIGNQILFTFPAIATIQGHVKTGKMKILALSGSERSTLFPKIPTFSEEGYPDLNIEGWYGFLAPAGTPKDVIEKFNTVLNKALDDPEFKKILLEQGTTPLKLTPQEMAKKMDEETAKTKKIVDMSKIVVD